MDTNFASIWIEVNMFQNRMLFAGFYREWSYDGSKTESSQLEGLSKFANQIERATNQSNKCVIVGDANLCSQKWRDPNYTHKLLANFLIDTLDQCGLTQKNVGETYMANNTQANGQVATSAIDHIYCSAVFEDSVCSKKLKISSTDHVPVIARVVLINPTKKEQITRKITKRSFKLFNHTSWNDALSKQDWSKVEKETDLNEAAKIFTKLIDAALDEAAPIKCFKVMCKT